MPKRDEKLKGERDGGEEGLGHSTKAVVADCSDNGLSSSEGLRGRREVQAFRALPPNTSLVNWESVGRVCVLEQGGSRRGERGTFPPAAYGFRQGAGTEQSAIWVSRSTPASQTQNTSSAVCPREPGPVCTRLHVLFAIHLSACSLSAAARFCQPHRLILGVCLSCSLSSPRPACQARPLSPRCVSELSKAGLDSFSLSVSLCLPQRLIQTAGWALMLPTAGETPLWGADSEAPLLQHQNFKLPPCTAHSSHWQASNSNNEL